MSQLDFSQEQDDMDRNTVIIHDILINISVSKFVVSWQRTGIRPVL